MKEQKTISTWILYITFVLLFLWLGIFTWDSYNRIESEDVLVLPVNKNECTIFCNSLYASYHYYEEGVCYCLNQYKEIYYTFDRDMWLADFDRDKV